jgi:hypothetical protein
MQRVGYDETGFIWLGRGISDSVVNTAVPLYDPTKGGEFLKQPNNCKLSEFGLRSTKLVSYLSSHLLVIIKKSEIKYYLCSHIARDSRINCAIGVNDVS